MRDSTLKSQFFRSCRRSSSSFCSSSDIKPRLPRLIPSTGTPWSATVRARCRIVPSPPKAMSRSARLISCWSWRMGNAQLVVVPLPAERGGTPPSQSRCPPKSPWSAWPPSIHCPDMGWGIRSLVSCFPVSLLPDRCVKRLLTLAGRGCSPRPRISSNSLNTRYSLRPADGRISDAKNCKVVFLCMDQEVFQHLQVYSRIPDNAFLPYLFPTGLELGLDEAGHLAVMYAAARTAPGK